MKSHISKAVLWTAMAFGALIAGGGVRAQTNILPANLCSVPPATFTSSWLKPPASGKPAGFNPPNSAAFTLPPNGQQYQDNCAFYQWASQMFLWLVTPDASGDFPMFSKGFFNVIPTSGGFDFQPLATNLRATVAGLKKSPLVFRARVNKSPTLLKGDAQPDSPGQASGQALILNGTAAAPVNLNSGTPATFPIVYYAMEVNDVWVGLANNQTNPKIAYFQSGPDKGNFPQTSAEVSQIQAAVKPAFTNPDLMALEVKTAWVETKYLPTPINSTLITVQASVPTYISATSGATATLTQAGSQDVTLALIGMHIVGTVQNHPEMVWATFETVQNAPNVAYGYFNTGTTIAANGVLSCSQTGPSGTNPCITVQTDSRNQQYVLYTPGSTQTVNSPTHTTVNDPPFPPTITLNATTWQADQIVRVNPYGNAPPANPGNASMSDINTANNTALAALKLSLIEDLAAGAKSKQLTLDQSLTLATYYQVGAVWTNRIVPMTSGFTEFGSLSLANATMESFIQTPTFGAPASGCFVCHNNSVSQQFNPNGVNVGISHVFPVSGSTP